MSGGQQDAEHQAWLRAPHGWTYEVKTLNKQEYIELVEQVWSIQEDYAAPAYQGKRMVKK